MQEKIETAHKIFKVMSKMCKEQKSVVDITQKRYIDALNHAQFECDREIVHAEYRQLIQEQGKLEGLVQAKISIEKYWRQLRHEQKESKEHS